jgi:hypothetical protein
MKTTTATGAWALQAPGAACRCTWDIQPRSAPVRLAPLNIPCPLHQQIQGEPDQPMVTGSRVPIL